MSWRICWSRLLGLGGGLFDYFMIDEGICD